MACTQTSPSDGVQSPPPELPTDSGAVGFPVPSFSGGDLDRLTAEISALQHLLMEERAERARLEARLHAAELEFRIVRTEQDQRIQARTTALTKANEELYAVILDRRRIATALRHAEEQYRGFFENAIVGIYQSTPDGRYVCVNPALARMYGYESAEQLLASVHDIANDVYVDPSVRNEFRRRMSEAGEVNGMNYQVRRRDGSVLWISEHARAVRDRRKRIVRYEGIVRDITPRKEAEEARARMEGQLQQAQKMEAIGTLAGGIAHDFNNILGAIIGYSELVADDLPAESLAHRNLQAVLGASVRAKELVQQILTFSRCETPELKPVRLQPILREVVKLLRAGLSANIRLRCCIESQSDRVVANPAQLHQVLMNLCTNAAHAMRERGGTLTLRLQDAPPPDGCIPPASGSGGVAVAVEDTGHGMTPEVVARIFEPFFTTKAVGEGTGLGLSVVHGIVRAHRGKITVASRPGAGTTFRVVLPNTDEEETGPVTPAAPTEAGRQERILLVDDDDALRRAMEQQLRRRGYRVRACRDSRKALRVFCAEPERFDLVVTDMSMPHLSGADLLRKIRALRPGFPVLLCSGSGDIIDSMPRDQVALGLLRKPAKAEALAAAVRSALEQAAAPSSAGDQSHVSNPDH